MSINNENENPLGYKNEGKLLVGFAIPCIISMLVTALSFIAKLRTIFPDSYLICPFSSLYEEP